MGWLILLPEGSLEVKLPTIWTDGKAEVGRVKEEKKRKWEDQRRERERRKKMQVREKVGKSRFTVFFQWFVAKEGRKVGSLKRRVRSQLARWEMENCTPLWYEAHFKVKMYNAPQLRSTFRSCDVEKVHAVVARSTFPSQNAQSTPFSDRWDVEKVHAVVARSTFPSQNVQDWWVRTTFRSCDVKKYTPLWREAHFQVKSVKNWQSLEVEMSKKCTPLWREAHFQIKTLKTEGVRATFWRSDVEKGRAVVGRSTFPSQKCKKLRGFVRTTFGRSDVEKVDTGLT